MSERDDDKVAGKRAEEFMQVFKKGAEFTQNLLKENERLRFRVLQLEEMHPRDEESGEVNAETVRLRQRLEELERQKEEILGRVRQIEAENVDFANRYVDIENENNML